MRRVALCACAFGFALLLALPSTLSAQQDDILSGKPFGRFGGLSGFGGGGDRAEEVVSVSAKFTVAEGGVPARLWITAKITPPYHTYSITQPEKGPQRTKIVLKTSPEYQVLGSFQPTVAPVVHKEPAFNNVEVEEHSGEVTWWAPIELAPGVDPTKVKIDGHVNCMACAEQCLAPKDYSFVATLGTAPPLPPAPAQPAAASVPPANGASDGFQTPRLHAVIRGWVEPQVVTPGSKLKLVIDVQPTEDYHVYAWAKSDSGAVGSKPTLIVLDEYEKFRPSVPRPSQPPHTPKQEPGAPPASAYHERQVTWTIDIEVPPGTAPGKFPLTGWLGLQTCHEARGCDMPHSIKFAGEIEVAGQVHGGRTPLTFSRGKAYKEVADKAISAVAVAPAEPSGFDESQLAVAEDDLNSQSTAMILVFAFLGGAILNLMPCVLPVIGLKILSFVEQSHQSRSQILKLNIWYSLGLISVFWALATLPVVWQLVWNQRFNWGQQFGNDAFNITLATIVWAMGLSMIGVWEIPIPGFLGSGKANELQQHEGVSGAFAKGVITTLLATPCTGPFVGTTVGWALRQPPYLIYTVFTAVGLGMASPYLLIGAFPRLIRFLPKPGAWMDTFKQVMGFVLLGTVVYLLTFVSWTLIVPTLTLLIGVWAGCWWIGRTPIYEAASVRTRSWVGGLIFSALIGWFAYGWLAPVLEYRFEAKLNAEIAAAMQRADSGAAQPASHTTGEADLAWQPFSKDALRRLTSEGKTVMVDFTADWCATCQTLKATVLDTSAVKEAVEKNGVVPLLADYTKTPPEITEMLEALKSGGVPVLAIFPASDPNRPIVYRELYTQKMLLESLEKAGPSKTTGAPRSTAMR